METCDAVSRCFRALANCEDARRATYYLTDRLTAKVTRKLRVDRRDRAATFLVTIGRPNYAERAYIKRYRKGEIRFNFPFGPILKFWPKKKRKD